MYPPELLAWCRHILALGEEVGVMSVVSGDASFRRYFRLRVGDQSWIAVHAPPDKENNQAFVDVAQLLARHALRVPDILAWDQSRGFLLLTDFGDQLLWPLLRAETVDQWYRASLQAMAQLQSIPISAVVLPVYDAPRLCAEMDLFKEWFVERLLGYELDETELSCLTQWITRLAQSAISQKQVVVHRDYHSRNLMVLADQAIGLIDFQDAVVGPCTYDLVSLLRDCYVAWPREQVEQWVEGYRRDFYADVDSAQFLRDFDWMGLQRHLKVLGIFARLHLRDGKARYLDDLPLVLHYTLSVARRYEEFHEFVSWFEQRLMPRVQQQSWYKTVTISV